MALADLGRTAWHVNTIIWRLDQQRLQGGRLKLRHPGLKDVKLGIKVCKGDLLGTLLPREDDEDPVWADFCITQLLGEAQGLSFGKSTPFKNPM